MVVRDLSEISSGGGGKRKQKEKKMESKKKLGQKEWKLQKVIETIAPQQESHNFRAYWPIISSL